MIAALKDDFDISVLAKPELGLPNTVNIPDGMQGVLRYLRATPFDVLYVNSFFDREYAMPLLVARRLGLIPQRATLVAPRGELLANTLQIKCAAKFFYIAAARRSGLLSDVWLQATSAMEYEELKRSFDWTRGTLLAEEICGPLQVPPRTQDHPGARPLRVVFLSRISEKKNLDYALAVLGEVKCPVEFQIFGPKDAAYWEACKRLITTLPDHIKASYKGTVPNTEVPSVLVDADLFFLPTRSENFGYAIYEALACGVPVLISDQTPWRDLERQSAGWDLPLRDKGAYARVIEHVAALNESGHERLRDGARLRAASYLAEQDAIENNRRMFRRLVSGGA
jgi:glycosyltransferase involved in cell wall biosynthesis